MSVKVAVSADWHVDSTAVGAWNQRLGMHSNWAESFGRVEEIVKGVNENDVDILVISGDIFNTGRPSAQAVKMLVERLGKIERAEIVVVNGNHDQQTVTGTHSTPIDVYLGELAGNMSGPKITVASEPVVYQSDHGIQLALLPWLRVAGQNALEDANERLRRAVDELAEDWDPNINGILTGHVTLSECTFGSGNRGSETKMSHEMLEASISANVLDQGPWNRTLLGHIHKRQNVTDKTRYVGSPYRVSFSEEDDKYYDVLTFDGNKEIIDDPIKLNSRKLLRVDLQGMVRVEDWENIVDDSQNGDIYRLQYDRDAPPSNMKELAEALKEKGVTVQRRGIAPESKAAKRTSTVTVHDDPMTVFQHFLKLKNVESENADELTKMFEGLQ